MPRRPDRPYSCRSLPRDPAPPCHFLGGDPPPPPARQPPSCITPFHSCNIFMHTHTRTPPLGIKVASTPLSVRAGGRHPCGIPTGNAPPSIRAPTARLPPSGIGRVLQRRGSRFVTACTQIDEKRVDLLVPLSSVVKYFMVVVRLVVWGVVFVVCVCVGVGGVVLCRCVCACV